ncbi:MAG: hypothetical protein BGN88_11710 [Clostridiales bacterium 43-6]|nr:MAG: hypothetical protein BGN88_11710 [Clostridiales bacterium 43-6]
MLKQKKSISLFLVLGMVISMSFAAPVAGASSNATVAKPVDKQFEMFLDSVKGFTLNIKNPWNGAAPGTKIYEKVNTAKRTVENKYTCIINETGLASNYDQAVTASLAAGRPIGHVLKVFSYNYNSYLKNNYFARLNVPMSASRVTLKEPWYNKDTRKYFNINNAQYSWVGSGGDPNVIVYNKTMLQRNNLVDPLTLVQNGTWTFDKLKEYSVALKSSSRNGFESSSALDTLTALVNNNGGRLYKIDSNDVLKTNYNDPRSLDGMQYFYDRSKDGSFSFPADTWDQAYRDFANKKTAMLHGAGYFQMVLPSNFGDQIGIVPFPKSQNVEQYSADSNIDFIDFIPSAFQADAAKILFIQNEYSKEMHQYKDELFEDNYSSLLGKDSPSFQMYKDMVYGSGQVSSGLNPLDLLFPSSADMYYGTMADKMLTSTPSSVINQNGAQLDDYTRKLWGSYTFPTLTPYRSGNYEYTVTGGKATILNYWGTESTVTVPEKLDIYPVSEISDGAFIEKDTITSVTLPKTIERIGLRGFYGCNKLSAVYFNGNAPIVDVDVFNEVSSSFKVYYTDSAAGFTNPWNGYPAQLYIPHPTLGNYRYSNGFLWGLPSDKLAYADFISGLKNPAGTVKIYDQKNAVITSGTIGTGYRVQIINGDNGSENTIILYGDINGDGLINAIDMVLLKKHALKIKLLTNPYLKAADISHDKIANSIDMVHLKKHILKISYINQNS